MRTCNAQELPRPLELATHVNDLQGRTIVNLVYRSDKLLLRLDNGAVAKLNMDPDEEAVELNPQGRMTWLTSVHSPGRRSSGPGSCAWRPRPGPSSISWPSGSATT